ncbi:MAG: c-type cytochrome [Gammaproteobacteria bacterium]
MKTSIVIATAGFFLMTCGIANARDGKEIYDGKCMACHTSGIANAPKLGDKAAWEPLAAQGVDALVASVKQGKNAMPPMGTCSDCTDDELKAVVQYMIDAAK